MACDWLVQRTHLAGMSARCGYRHLERDMTLSRRNFGAHITGAAVGAALAACGADGAGSTTSSKRSAVLLVHDSWLGDWCFSDRTASN